MNEPYLAVLGRARPVAIHGKATSFTSDPETGRMHIEADAQAKDRKTLSFSWKLGEAGPFCKEISQARVPGHATGASYD